MWERYAVHGLWADSPFMVPESKTEQTEHGLVPRGEGWFVLNLRDAVWRHADGRGAVCLALDDFEDARRATQLGFNPFVLAPGEPMAMYHCHARVRSEVEDEAGRLEAFLAG